MSQQDRSIGRIVFWALAIALIGVYAIYSFYTETLKQRLAAKNAEIAQTTQRVKDLEQSVERATSTEKDLRSQIADLESRRRSERADLQSALGAANQANVALQGQMDALREQDAQTLAAERQKASEASAKLQEAQEAADKKIAELGAQIEELKGAQAEAAKQHKAELDEAASKYDAQLAEATAKREAEMAKAQKEQEAKLQQTEQQLNERVDYFRTALEGSDPERAVQLAGLKDQARADRKAQEDAEHAQQALEAAKSDLAQRLADTSQALETKSQALTQADSNLDALRSKLAKAEAELQALRSQHETAMAQSAKDLAAAQEQLQSTQATHVSKMTEAEGKIASLNRDLQSVQADLTALRREHGATVAELREKLADAGQALSAAKDDLKASEDASAKTNAELQRRIKTAEGRAGALEKTLAQERQKAAADHLADLEESKKAQSYLRDLYTELSRLGGRQTERGMLLTLADSDLRFATGQADIPAGDLPSLDRIAQLLIQHPELKVRIEGHTDNAGRPESNVALSQKRADAVKQALVERGVAADRIVAEGVGEARPIANNATPAGRQENRRVEIYVTDERGES
jgi:chemotaxis protein MotB